jgi:Ca2+-binding EF-hand superfamily protein
MSSLETNLHSFLTTIAELQIELENSKEVLQSALANSSVTDSVALFNLFTTDSTISESEFYDFFTSNGSSLSSSALSIIFDWTDKDQDNQITWGEFSRTFLDSKTDLAEPLPQSEDPATTHPRSPSLTLAMIEAAERLWHLLCTHLPQALPPTVPGSKSLLQRLNPLFSQTSSSPALESDLAELVSQCTEVVDLDCDGRVGREDWRRVEELYLRVREVAEGGAEEEPVGDKRNRATSDPDDEYKDEVKKEIVACDYPDRTVERRITTRKVHESRTDNHKAHFLSATSDADYSNDRSKLISITENRGEGRNVIGRYTEDEPVPERPSKDSPQSELPDIEEQRSDLSWQELDKSKVADSIDELLEEYRKLETLRNDLAMGHDVDLSVLYNLATSKGGDKLSREEFHAFFRSFSVRIGPKQINITFNELVDKQDDDMNFSQFCDLFLPTSTEYRSEMIARIDNSSQKKKSKIDDETREAITEVLHSAAHLEFLAYYLKTQLAGRLHECLDLIGGETITADDLKSWLNNEGVEATTSEINMLLHILDPAKPNKQANLSQVSRKTKSQLVELEISKPSPSEKSEVRRDFDSEFKTKKRESTEINNGKNYSCYTKDIQSAPKINETIRKYTRTYKESTTTVEPLQYSIQKEATSANPRRPQQDLKLASREKELQSNRKESRERITRRDNNLRREIPTAQMTRVSRVDSTAKSIDYRPTTDTYRERSKPQLTLNPSESHSSLRSSFSARDELRSTRSQRTIIEFISPPNSREVYKERATVDRCEPRHQVIVQSPSCCTVCSCCCTTDSCIKCCCVCPESYDCCTGCCQYVCNCSGRYSSRVHKSPETHSSKLYLKKSYQPKQYSSTYKTTTDQFLSRVEAKVETKIRRPQTTSSSIRIDLADSMNRQWEARRHKFGEYPYACSEFSAYRYPK